MTFFRLALASDQLPVFFVGQPLSLAGALEMSVGLAVVSPPLGSGRRFRMAAHSNILQVPQLLFKTLKFSKKIKKARPPTRGPGTARENDACS